MKAIRISSRLLVLTLIIIVSASGCKSKKKAMEAAAAEKARLEQQDALRKQQEEEQRRKDAEEKARLEAQQRENDIRSNEPKAKLNQYFDAIAGSSDVASANSSINEVLTLFASPETPVLIVINESGGQKDYDRPTTIKNYLNYLKDQKKNANRISDLRFDAAGKIIEVELRKN